MCYVFLIKFDAFHFAHRNFIISSDAHRIPNANLLISYLFEKQRLLGVFLDLASGNPAFLEKEHFITNSDNGEIN